MFRSLQFIVVIVAWVFPIDVFGQTVFIREGNVFFKAKEGSAIRLTSSGLDLDPSLSLDKRLVVFVRRTPSSRIDTGAGPLDTNELWVADTTKGGRVHRLLAGHSGDYKADIFPLAGFSSPRLSPDDRRVYFLAQIAATSQHVFLLDLESEQLRFVCRGISLEVLNSGQYAGFLIVLKDVPRVMPGHICRYWLLDRDGKDVGEIGEKESDVLAFKTGRF